MRIDLGIGNSVAVREAFIQSARCGAFFSERDLLKFDYPSFTGDSKLIEITKEVILRQTGIAYKHVFLTSGATGGCVISLRAAGRLGIGGCKIRKPPYYTKYPSMIAAAGLSMEYSPSCVNLIDIPSNPLGYVDRLPTSRFNIMDCVYYNNVYMDPLKRSLHRHNISADSDSHLMVGSYSKLTGLNGIRVGWIATNNGALVKTIEDLVIAEYGGISTASQEILKQLIQFVDWYEFEILARNKLDLNRELFSKLEKYFGDTPVSPIGMFYYAPTDTACRNLLKKSNIEYTCGSTIGTSDEYGRFSLGNSNEITELAVKSILKNDSLPR